MYHTRASTLDIIITTMEGKSEKEKPANNEIERTSHTVPSAT